jgi:hypothetical protein
MYVYIKSEPGLYTVGFYDPSGEWQSESDHDSSAEAAAHVAWLNGSGPKCQRCGDDGKILIRGGLGVMDCPACNAKPT